MIILTRVFLHGPIRIREHGFAWRVGASNREINGPNKADTGIACKLSGGFLHVGRERTHWDGNEGFADTANPHSDIPLFAKTAEFAYNCVTRAVLGKDHLAVELAAKCFGTAHDRSSFHPIFRRTRRHLMHH